MIVGLDDAVSVLRAGGLVAFPTETVYGLGADATNTEAIERVYATKGRPARNPLIVHVLDEAMARRYAATWPARASRLARAFWPGPVTAVVAKARSVPGVVTGGGSTVALRSPDHPVALDLVERFGDGIVGPSANRSGGVSPTRAEHVEAEFEGGVPVLDGGVCARGIESTVVRVDGEIAEVLRVGVIGCEEIGAALGEHVHIRGASDARGEVASPGLVGRHYSPRTRVVLVERANVPEAVAAVRGDAVIIWCQAAAGIGAEREIELGVEPAGYARWLYAALREADGAGVCRIVVERPTGAGPTWDAVRDRLGRASSE